MYLRFTMLILLGGLSGLVFADDTSAHLEEVDRGDVDARSPRRAAEVKQDPFDDIREE